VTSRHVYAEHGPTSVNPNMLLVSKPPGKRSFHALSRRLTTQRLCRFHQQHVGIYSNRLVSYAGGMCIIDAGSQQAAQN
jgi:hypothetical protein